MRSSGGGVIFSFPTQVEVWQRRPKPRQLRFARSVATCRANNHQPATWSGAVALRRHRAMPARLLNEAPCRRLTPLARATRWR